jgi:hypothetical protein
MPPLRRRCSSVRRWMASATAVSGVMGGPASRPRTATALATHAQDLAPGSRTCPGPGHACLGRPVPQLRTSPPLPTRTGWTQLLAQKPAFTSCRVRLAAVLPARKRASVGAFPLAAHAGAACSVWLHPSLLEVYMGPRSRAAHAGACLGPPFRSARPQSTSQPCHSPAHHTRRSPPPAACSAAPWRWGRGSSERLTAAACPSPPRAR